MAAETKKPRAQEPVNAFEIGQLVRHRRYRYRGVVVAHDECCQADDDWYNGNKTQPDREQPWYHVLVHGGVHSTYAAEENLSVDTSGEQVVHPLVTQVFDSFTKGRYILRTEFSKK